MAWMKGFFTMIEKQNYLNKVTFYIRVIIIGEKMHSIKYAKIAFVVELIIMISIHTSSTLQNE